jgi:hypothetical protein
MAPPPDRASQLFAERVSKDSTEVARALTVLGERLAELHDPAHADLARKAAKTLLRLAFDALGHAKPLSVLPTGEWKKPEEDGS